MTHLITKRHALYLFKYVVYCTNNLINNWFKIKYACFVLIQIGGIDLLYFGVTSDFLHT